MSKKKNTGDKVGFEHQDKNIWRNPSQKTEKILRPLPAPLKNIQIPEL